MWFRRGKQVIRIEGNRPCVDIVCWDREAEAEVPLKGCVIDTGCTVDVVLPEDEEAKCTCVGRSFHDDVRVADDRRVPVRAGLMDIEWLGQWQSAEVKIVKGRKGSPLLGLPLLKNTRIKLTDSDGSVEDAGRKPPMPLHQIRDG